MKKTVITTCAMVALGCIFIAHAGFSQDNRVLTDQDRRDSCTTCCVISKVPFVPGVTVNLDVYEELIRQCESVCNDLEVKLRCMKPGSDC